MALGTDFITPNNRIADNDFRATVRGSDISDDTDSGGGWTWVAALLIAALFIVSGYLDQESGLVGQSSTNASADRYAAHGPQMSVGSSAGDNGDRQSDKGY